MIYKCWQLLWYCYEIVMILLNKFCIQRTSTMEQWSGVKMYDLQMWVIIMVLL